MSLVSIKSKLASKFSSFLKNAQIKRQENLKNIKPMTKRQKQILSFVCVASLFLLPEVANAAAANPILAGLNWLVTLLTSTLARSIAILGVAVAGYMALAGKLTGEWAARIIGGICFIFGGATIVDLISAVM